MDEAAGQELEELANQLANGAPVMPSSADYVRLSHTLPSGTAGGSSSAGAWRTRPLNTIDADPANICTLTANEFTLPAGTYEIQASSVLVGARNNAIRVYNVSDVAPVLYSTSEYIGLNTEGQGRPTRVSGMFSIASSKTFRIEYRVGFSQSQGLGTPNNFSVPEVFAVVELWRLPG